MPFFIQGANSLEVSQPLLALTEYEYFDNQPTPEEQRKSRLAQPFKREQEMAWFVVWLGFSIDDYYRLTDLEKRFIRKEFENKTIFHYSMIANSTSNAIYNSNRKKGKQYQPLFKKKTKAPDGAAMDDAIQAIVAIESAEGKGWVERVYNGIGWKK